MAGTTHTPRTLSSQTQDIFVEFTERLWPGEVIDRFVVGRIHRGDDLVSSCRHLSLAFHDFAGVQAGELEHFEKLVLPKTNIVDRWSSKPANDAEVKKVLVEIGMLTMVDYVKEVENMSRIFSDATETLRRQMRQWGDRWDWGNRQIEDVQVGSSAPSLEST